MAVYVSCCNAQSKSHSDPLDISCCLYSINCPTVIYLPSMCYFILWRDTTSELWTPVLFPLYCYHLFTLLIVFTLLAYYYYFPLDTLIPLFTANRWDWQPHRKLGAKYLVVLCAGSMLLLVEDALTRFIVNGALVGVSLGYQASPSVVWLLPIRIDKPWFLTEGRPCCYIHHTFLLGFPTGWCFSLSTPCRITLLFICQEHPVFHSYHSTSVLFF
jgi:hypothetical protein